jgi:hypothetical protein
MRPVKAKCKLQAVQDAAATGQNPTRSRIAKAVAIVISLMVIIAVSGTQLAKLSRTQNSTSCVLHKNV